MALRILLADDSMTAQNMGKKILTDAGYEVVTVSNGAAAVKKIAEVLPDLAILDVYMPGYNGLEVCERVKLSSATTRTPVLLSVGKMEPFRPEDGMKVKADGVIIKPFEATDLVTVVEKLVTRGSATSSAPVAAAAAAVAGAAAVASTAPSTAVAAAPSPVASAPVSGPSTFVPPPPPPPPAFAPPAPSFAPQTAHVPEPAPVLQTFEPADEPVDIPEEPHIVPTSFARAAAVEAVTPPEFQTTALQDATAESQRHVMTDAALLDGYNFSTPARDQESATEDVLSDEDREFLSMTARSDAVPADSHDASAADYHDAFAELHDATPSAPQEESSSAPLDEPLAEVAEPNAPAEPVASVEPAPSQTAAAPATWLAEEEELTADDLALDLEQVIQSQPASEPAAPAAAEHNSFEGTIDGSDVVTDFSTQKPAAPHASPDLAISNHNNGDGGFDPFLDLTAAQTAAPDRSAATPMLAPLGKTSFDDLDAIMEQAASKFDASVSAPAQVPAPADSEADVLFSDDAQPQEPGLEPDLMIEEAPVDLEPAPAQLHNSSGLNGVFDLDPPAPAEPQAQQPAVDEVTSDVLHQPESATSQDFLQHYGIQQSDLLDDPMAADLPEPPTAAAHELSREAASELAPALPDFCMEPELAVAEQPQQVISGAEDSEQVISSALMNDAAPADGLMTVEPAVAEVETAKPAIVPPATPEGAGHHVAADSASEPSLVDHATDLAVAAVNAEIQCGDGAVPRPADHPVERVVERVVDRLRPMLTVMVEEIMKELKKN